MTTPSFRKLSTPFSRAIISSCLACADRPRAASFAPSPTLLDRTNALHRGMRNSRQPLRPPLPPLPRLIARKRRRHSHRLPEAATQRYVEKLATPDVTIADLIGDIDPIKAARGGHELSSEFTVHYGLLPRANRGIFAINELPDLAGKIQVGLFNIMQEGDVQIKGYPVRLPLDVALVFSANPEDYTARGKIITPLKDRIGSEIRTHYPATVDEGIAITAQEAWTARNGNESHIPKYVREVIERIAFAAREDKKIDKRSGVSQRLPISAWRTCFRMPSAARSATERRSLSRAWATFTPPFPPSPENSNSSTKAR